MSPPFGPADDNGRELEEELAFHLDAVTEELEAEGWEPEAAAAEARRRFGDLEGTRAYCRSEDARHRAMVRRRETMGTFVQDVRHAIRQLRRAPGYAFAAAGSLALGVGAVTAILSLVEGILLRPLPYPEPERLVRLWDTSAIREGWDRVNVNPANFRDWQVRSSAFERLAGYTPEEITLRDADGAERVPAAYVTAGLFETLGGTPTLGRTVSESEDLPGSEARVVVISHAAWVDRFGADPGVVGRTLTLQGLAHEVIGVAPEGFLLPAVSSARQPHFYLPGGFGEPNGRGGHWLIALGRLAPGVSLGRAQEEMSSIAAALADEHPRSNEGLDVRLEPLHEAEVGGARPVLLLFLGAVALLLLIACVNLAGLVMLRNLGRERELAVRTALGAGRARLLRQLLTETVVLAVIGGLVGSLLAWALVVILPATPGLDLPRLDRVHADPRVFGAAFGVALVSSLCAALAPSLGALARDPAGATHGARAPGAVTHGGATPVAVLTVVEIALSVLLVTGSGLLARSYLELASVDPGFQAEGAAVVRIVVPETEYDDRARADLYARILERVRALPGVRAAGAGDSPPFQRAQNSRTSYYPDDRPRPEPGEPSRMAWEEYATPGYFEALGIPLVAGRGFEDSDDRDAPPVAIVSTAFAEATWPGGRAVGETFTYNTISWEVVGVVGGTKRRGMDDTAEPEMFFPPAQQPWWVPSAVFIVVRTAGDPLMIVPPVRRVVAELAPDVPVASSGAMESLVAVTLAPARFRWLLVSAFAVAAVALALLGVYGVLAHGVARRRHEIGVRMALGAARASVGRLVVRRGLALTAMGVVLGVGGTLALGDAVSTFLFDVRPLDPPTLAAVAVLFTTAGLAASWIPARRATRVDPVQTLTDDAR